MIGKVLSMLFGRGAADIGEDIRREAADAKESARHLQRVAYGQVSDAFRIPPENDRTRIMDAIDAIMIERARRRGS